MQTRWDINVVFHQLGHLQRVEQSENGQYAQVNDTPQFINHYCHLYTKKYQKREGTLI